MKHIKIFDTVARLNQFKSSQNYIKPNVSLCEDNPTTVYYDPYVAPVAPAHDYVEIGGIKWATMNLGANSVTDEGLYYQWGDTQGYTPEQVGSGEGQKYFAYNDYKYYNNGYYTKYNENDELITLQPSDDAATAAWGGNWRIPTISEWIILKESVDTSWTNDYQGSGIKGLILTDKTDNTKILFFPACGKSTYSEYNNYGDGTQYWSSSVNTDCGCSNALTFTCYSMYNIDTTSNVRYDGLPIRPILDE